RIKGWMFEGHSKGPTGSAERILERFRSRLELFENVFQSLFRAERLRRVDTLDDRGFPQSYDRLLQHVHRCITGYDHPFALPQIPVYLNDVLASQDFTGGVEPLIGRKHIRVIALDGFPRTSS